MNNKCFNLNFYLLLLFIIFIQQFLTCSKTTSTQITGGSGAGNPGGYVTVALIVDTLIQNNLSKNSYNTLKLNKNLVLGTGSQFKIVDDSGLNMIVTEAIIYIKAIHFMLETGQQPSKLLESFNQPLQYDSTSIILNGPFVFDAIGGICTPSIDTLKLPEAKYTGIKLLFDTNNLQKTPRAQAGKTNYSVEINGNFNYHSTQRNFSFLLDVNQPIIYPHYNTFSVVRNDTANINVIFNPQNWLKGISLLFCLDNNFIIFENNGDLIITENSGQQGPCNAIESTIRRNLIDSGKLNVW
jgi:hypothetical protein